MAGEITRIISPLRASSSQPHSDPAPDSAEDTLCLDNELEDELEANSNLVLVGKILEGKPYRRQAVHEALVATWHLIQGVHITPTANNCFIFQFSHPMDVINVLEGEPWAVSGNLLILEHWNEEGNFPFNSTDFWVHSLKIPPELLFLDLGLQLARKVGVPSSVMLIQDTYTNLRRSFFRCRITVNVQQPLKAEVIVKRHNGTQVRVPMGYERLPLFCYFCGCFGHEERRCVAYFEAQQNHHYAHGSNRTENWALIGDFNSFLSWHEKLGGYLHRHHDVQQFRQVLQGCNLMDIAAHGPSYTWTNRRRGGANIKIKLDRVLCNQAWRRTFEDATAYVRPSIGSDHFPVYVDTQGGKIHGAKPFRFEAMWFSHPDCKAVAQEAWSLHPPGNAGNRIHLKSANVQQKFTKWNRENFGNVQRKIEGLLHELAALQDCPSTDLHHSREQELRSLLEVELDREEMLWHKKSRNLWLMCGDRNTKFFHASTLQRRHRNKFLKLKLPNGDWSQAEPEIFREFLSHYQLNFSSEGLDEEALHLVNLSIRPVIDSQTNEHLCKIPDLKEVHQALLAMAPLKSPGPDGLPPSFFQRYWDLNNQPEGVDQYRPINLCNVVVKIITKILATRLKHTLDKIIAPNQSAFIPDRLISDNILLAHEAFHYINHKKKGQKRFVALKLDMKKAYDCLEWGFIERVLLRMGFDQKFVALVMACISLVSYGLIINGAVRGSVSPTRGIRQGDPLSPTLFVLCSQALSSLLLQAQEAGLIKGMKIRNRAMPLSHLLFADDSLLFTEVNIDEVLNLKGCMDIYCRASGQQINLKKSLLTFSPNTVPKFRRWFSRLLKIPYGSGPKKYLGLPTEFGTAKKGLFREIQEKTYKRLQGWKGLLSHAGKEVLIKSVALSLNTYASSHFKLPEAHHRGIRQAVTQFYWGGMDDTHKISWISWNRLCKSKENGARLGSSPSWAWRSVIEGRKVLLDGLVWIIGDGKNTRIWEDAWLPSSPSLRLQFPDYGEQRLVYVSELIDEVNRCWNLELINSLFHPIDRKAILHVQLSLFPSQDYRVWSGSQNGVYSAKSGYHFLCNQQELQRIRSFLWRACANGVATGAALVKRQCNVNPECARCGAEEETIDHIILDCPFSRATWFGSQLSYIPPIHNPSLTQVINDWSSIFPVTSQPSKEVIGLSSFICWNLWKARNNLVFNGQLGSPKEVLFSAEKEFREFSSQHPQKPNTESQQPKVNRDNLSWTPPEHMYKLNTDASLSDGTSGIGFVFRNSIGEPLVACSEPIKFNSILQGETLAVRAGL
ncbi:uncharacterized protein LOC122645101 [Telopea speciosissima]|uniref:uncharacterized protein LOC122645101 n=1 Tax=Telopea speciosissima TaxID=54955 RepID=UPI001CC36C62|nr:uncharacterized protein LOC122645101 [Telopea speciosissima]